MNRSGLRFKIIIWSALSSGVALLVFGVGAAINLYSEQLESVDKGLTAHAREFFAVLEERGNALDWSDPNVRADLLGHDPDVLGFAFGRSVQRTTHFYPAEMETIARNWPQAEGIHLSLKLGSHPIRLGVFKKDGQQLLLASDLADSREVVRDLFTSYAICLPVAAFLVGVGGWLIAQRALRPIDDIATAAENISANRLHERLPTLESNDELSRLTRVLNRMIERLENGFRQATRFTADASHELRTPLTIVRGQLEELIRSGGFNESQETALVDLLDETLRLQRISDQLLLLARFDSGRVPIPKISVNVSALLTEVVEDVEALAEQRHHRLATILQPEIYIEGDSGLLQCVLFNLYVNAVKYSPDGSLIESKLEADDSTVVFTISNPGPAIPADRALSIFERFSREDSSRNRLNGGNGLGLSLCKEIVHAHSGWIKLMEGGPEKISFAFSIPLFGTNEPRKPSAERS